jgi:hypothetical protein
MTRAGNGMDRLVLVVLDDADPRHPVTTELDDHIAHFLEQLVLITGAEQNVVALAQSLKDLTEP